MIELGKRHRPSNYSRAVAKRAKLREEWGGQREGS